MLRVAIIVGSTRPGRKGEAVARWVYEIADSRSDAEFELAPGGETFFVTEPVPGAVSYRITVVSYDLVSLGQVR